MQILEFIEKQYPIRDKVVGKLEDPYKRIANMDDLPFDIIGPDEVGHITKLVEVEDSRFISVVELIGMTRDDVVHSGDSALLIVWENYMSQIDLHDMNIVDIMESVRTHQDIERTRKEQLDVLSL